MRDFVKIHTSPFFLVNFLFFLLIFCLIIIRVVPIQAYPALDITVKTDKQKYYAKDALQVYGNLTLDGVLVPDGLVGIQIQTSRDTLLVIRTLSTGNPPPETPYVFLEYVAPCDQNGDPQFSFRKGTLANFKVSIVNFDIEPRDALMTINTYYSDNSPFGYASINTTIFPSSSATFVISIPIPADAVLGTANAYANAYTNLPKLAGTPYCSEVNATFQITDTSSLIAIQTAQSPPPTIQQTDETGNFNLTLPFPRKIPYGDCTVYVTARYLGESIFNSTTFGVYQLGDLGSGPPPTFFDFDGAVDAFDFTLWKACYDGVAPPEAMYLGDLGTGPPPTFFAFDGIIDSFDFALWKACYDGLGP